MTIDQIAAALTRAGVAFEETTEDHPYRHYFIGDLTDAADRRVVTVDMHGACGTVCVEVVGTGVSALSPVSNRQKLPSIAAVVAFMRDSEAREAMVEKIMDAAETAMVESALVALNETPGIEAREAKAKFRALVEKALGVTK